jgi:isoleucyl-tRNA synthetase
VHQAPAFGEDDFRTCTTAGIVDHKHLPLPLTSYGTFTAEVGVAAVAVMVLTLLLLLLLLVVAIMTLLPVMALGLAMHRPQVPEFEGLNIHDANEGICKLLKEKGRLHAKGSVVHSYPFCWRSDKPLIYRFVIPCRPASPVVLSCSPVANTRVS